MINDLHDNHFHLMISVWPYFDPGSQVYREMDKRGYYIDRTKTAAFHPARMALYDAFSPAARKYYWGLMENALFNLGADAWWRCGSGEGRGSSGGGRRDREPTRGLRGGRGDFWRTCSSDIGCGSWIEYTPGEGGV